MPELGATVISALSGRYSANLARIRELAAPLSEQQFWTKPYPYGNSFGHLVLHLTGNLNYYIGAQIANTGYVREREREFTDANPPAKEEALKRLDSAVSSVLETIRSQSPADWSRTYSAVGTNCADRLDIVLQCAAHMQHHIGQMIYLGYEIKRR
ncbi:MAG TPA: DinB family protein [Verrucomicrobiae bacterium]|nr:DinB family protein [Verrucomicrobiae bacterium]